MLVLQKLAGCCGPSSADSLDFSFFKSKVECCTLPIKCDGDLQERMTGRLMSSLAIIKIMIVGPHPLAFQVQSYSRVDSLGA